MSSKSRSRSSKDRKAASPASGQPAAPASSHPAPQIAIKSKDISDEMEETALNAAKKAVSENQAEKQIAQTIKKAMDTKHGTHWHCVVGREFGSFVTHEEGHYLYFYTGVGTGAVLLFKSP